MSAIVHRGHFQGRRIRFLAEVALRLDGAVRLVWLNSAYKPGQPVDWFPEFEAAEPRITARHELDGRRRGLPSALRQLRRGEAHIDGPVLAVGFSALPYAWSLRRRPLIWCLQGIPEERLMHRDSPADRFAIQARWRGMRLGPRPDAVLVVSDGMRKLLHRRMPGVPCISAPSTTIVSTFEPPSATRRRLLTYLGSGAPWQHLDLLADVWREVHRLDPSTRFLAVTRDERAAVLGHGLPPGVFEMVTAHEPEEVARWLWETELGFIVRRPHLVNSVASPTKFAEFVAAGVPVVVTDIGWDIADIVRETGCGVLVDGEASPHSIARDVVGYRRAHLGTDAVAQGCHKAAARVDRATWIDRLAADLNGVVSVR